MDIDDILASVDRDDFSSPESTALDHQVLTRFWVAERAVSELLPWPGPLMDRMMERVRKQVSLTASTFIHIYMYPELCDNCHCAVARRDVLLSRAIHSPHHFFIYSPFHRGQAN